MSDQDVARADREATELLASVYLALSPRQYNALHTVVAAGLLIAYRDGYREAVELIKSSAAR